MPTAWAEKEILGFGSGAVVIMGGVAIQIDSGISDYVKKSISLTAYVERDIGGEGGEPQYVMMAGAVVPTGANQFSWGGKTLVQTSWIERSG